MNQRTRTRRQSLKPGTRVIVNENGEASVRGMSGTVRRGTTLVSVVVELWNSEGHWVGTKRMPAGHVTTQA